MHLRRPGLYTCRGGSNPHGVAAGDCHTLNDDSFVGCDGRNEHLDLYTRKVAPYISWISCS